MIAMNEHNALKFSAPHFQERHYTVKELVFLWRLSDKTVRKLLRHEAGIIRIDHPDSRRRVYCPVRIPESTAERVYKKLTSRRAA